MDEEYSKDRDVYKAATSIFEVKVPVTTLMSTELTNVVPNDTVSITDGIYEDSGLQEWCNRNCYLQGGKDFLWKIVSNPTYNVATLQDRQRRILSFGKNMSKISALLRRLQSVEKDILWICSISDIKKAWPANLLFPSGPVLKYLNYNIYILNAFHLYRCVISPIMNAVTPLATVFAPYVYLKRKMNLPLSLGTYIHLLWVTVREAIKMGGSIRQGATRFVTVLVYIFIYFYNIVQGYHYTRMLYQLRKVLVKKAQSLSTFVATFKKLEMVAGIPKSRILSAAPNVSSLYSFITVPERRIDLFKMLEAVYTTDAYFVATNHLLGKKGYSPVKFTDSTKLYNMGHVLLGTTQVCNPCTLDKSLVITGPNAAGKTTYTKALCANIILSQSLGIARATEAHIAPVHAIGSFMRVTDTVGKQSLFEAEVKRCSEICQQAHTAVSAGKRAVYFLDEPMHSTPPLEGTATSFAVLEYLGKLPGVKVVLTTHYHELRILGVEASDYFKNISMEAIASDKGFIFPYTIRSGASLQSIALELLDEKDLHPSIVKRAINIKEKLLSQCD